MNSALLSKLLGQNKEELEIQKSLKSNILFESLNKKEFSIVEKIIHIRKYGVGEHIFYQHHAASGMYIIVRGRISISSDKIIFDDENNEEQRESTIITNLNGGDFFGELALIDDKALRSATARVMESATLIGFFKPDLLEIMETHPVIGMKILFKIAQVLGKRLIDTNQELADLRDICKKPEGKQASKVCL
jgi:CRP/FNR family transcriptional regulator, cyclic AMP receptor protein